MKALVPKQPPIHLSHSRNSQAAFTLIELMVAIVLGLLISAAALQLLLGSSKNLRIQEGADDVQDAAVFSLSYIQKEIAMANLGAYQPMTKTSPWTGIVLTSSTDHESEQLPDKKKRQIGNLRGIELIDKSLLSQSAVKSDDVTNSNVNIESDQLTIQYKAPFDLYDCEGHKRDKGQMVIERFFTRQDNVMQGSDKALNIVLACDAGWYVLGNKSSASTVGAGSIKIHDFGDAGNVLINRVDYFKVKLGVRDKKGIIYLPINDYMTNDALTGPIVAVQIGVIARGVDPIGTEATTSYNILDAEVTIDNKTKSFVRRVYESTIRLRNATTQIGGSAL